MRSYAIVITSVMISLFVTSCSYWDEPAGNNNPVYGTIGTYELTSSKVTYFVLDDGTTLGLNNNLEIADSLVGTRFYIDFQYANVTNRTDSFDATINLLNIQQVVTKPILIVETKSQLDSMGVNKINPSWLWCSSHYLNIVYYVMGSNSLPHRVNLIENLIDPMELSGDTLVFELRQIGRASCRERV